MYFRHLWYISNNSILFVASYALQGFIEMDQHDIEMTISDALSALNWQIEMGADETLSDEAIDRYSVVEAQIAAKAAAAQSVIDTAKQTTSPTTKTQQPAMQAARSASAPLGAAEAITAAQKSAANCTTLVELKQAINQFDGLSALKRSATQTVFGGGNPNADIMIIGEAPSREDDSSGIAISGPAGEMLNKMFGAIGLTREALHITNMIYWRPPGDRSPTDSEMAVFKPFLDKHIELVQPKILVLLGTKPAQTYLNQTSNIARLRGKWSNVTLYQNPTSATIAMFHPTFLLKNPSQKRLAWQDLLAIKAKLQEK